MTMPYSAICRDREDTPTDELRQRALRKHLDYIATIQHKVLVAGPLSIGASTGFNASLFVYDCDDPEEARQLLEGDPYWQAGIYGEITWARFTPARGIWLSADPPETGT